MTMKGQKTSLIPCMGINDSLDAPKSSASSVVNMRYDIDNKAWRADRGLEEYWKHKTGWAWSASYPMTAQAYLDSKIDSVFIWKKQNSNEVYHFVEQGGYLYFFLGNKGQGSTYSGTYHFDDITILQSDRHIPKNNEVGTQYIPYGNHLLIINGVDAPIWFTKEGKWRDFGFTLPTPSLEAIAINPDYIQGSKLEGETGAPFFANNSIYGLGDPTGKKNQYYWKMSYVTDTGSESPLSESSAVSWTVDQSGSPKDKFGVSIQLPRCPKGAMTRRIYRTKNMWINSDGGSTGDNQTYYFVKEIKSPMSNFYIDYISDLFLTGSQPASSDSVVVNTDWTCGENWDGRIWLASGNKIIFSQKGLPEQFNAFNYFNLGNTEGGDITGLKAYYNSLIVFRRNAVSIITTNGDGYSIASITSSIGTTATNAIVFVPAVGVVFPSYDGIYALNGGLYGGSNVKIQKISSRVNKEWSQLNTGLLNKAIGAYSSYEREIWIHYPADYSTVPNKGLVFHLGDDFAEWSTRKELGDTDNGYFSFSAMTTTLDGRFLFGIKPTWNNGLNLNSTCVLFAPLHVWSASYQWSRSASIASTTEGNLTFSFSTNTRLPSEWISSSLSVAPSMFRIYNVEAEMLSYGDIGLNLSYLSDYGKMITGTAQKQADPKLVFTKSEPPVTVAVDDGTVTKNPFYISQDYVIDHRKVILRYDVNTSLCDSFKFRFYTANSEPFTVRSFLLNTKNENVPVMNQTIRKRIGQPR